MKLFLTNTSPFNDKAHFEAVFSRMPLWRQEKILAFFHAKDRNLSLGASWVLEQGLQQYDISLAHCVAESVQGKPSLPAHPHVHFSISHSEALVGVLFSEDIVGFDIEEIQKDLELTALEKRVLHPQEKIFIETHCPDSSEKRTKLFYALWTLKESYLKALGCGLCEDPKSIMIPMEALTQLIQKPTQWYIFTHKDWTWGSVSLQHASKDYALAFCSKTSSAITITWL